MRWSTTAKDEFVCITYPGGRYLDFTYDLLGRRSSLTDQTGERLTYYYDASGALSRVADAAGTDYASYSYDSLGRLTEEVRGNGVETGYAYDLAGQILTKENSGPTGAYCPVSSTDTIAWGGSYRRRRLDGEWSYAYDGSSQLREASFISSNPLVPNKALTYSYDAAGNRTRVVEDGAASDYSANAANQYTKAGGSILAYDADGNLTESEDGGVAWTYGYDDENRLIMVAHGSDTWVYGYDALGNRATETKNGVTKHFVIDPFGLGNRVGEYDPSGCSDTHAMSTVSACGSHRWGLRVPRLLQLRRRQYERDDGCRWIPLESVHVSAVRAPSLVEREP